MDEIVREPVRLSSTCSRATGGLNPRPLSEMRGSLQDLQFLCGWPAR